MSELIQFLTKDVQAKLDAYWGLMLALGSLGGRLSVFRVLFHDNTAHKRHQHPRHDEIVVVTAGAILQVIGDQAMRLEVGESAKIPRMVPHKATPLVPGTEVVVLIFGDDDRYESIEMEEPDGDQAARSTDA